MSLRTINFRELGSLLGLSQSLGGAANHAGGLRVQGARVVALLKTYRARANQRRLLAQLNDAALKDMGISRIDALNEANKAFWEE